MPLQNDLVGAPIVEQQQTGIEAVVPSPVEVEATWRRVVVDADRVDALLARILAFVLGLKKWRHLGLVTDDEMDQAETWLRRKRGIVAYLLGGRAINTFLDETYIDGTGI